MSNEKKLPNLNKIQINQIIKHLKETTFEDSQEDMDKVSEQIAELLLLNGFSNSACSYVLIEVQRNIIERDKNKAAIEKVIGQEIPRLNVDDLLFFQKVWTKDYIKGYRVNGHKK